MPNINYRRGVAKEYRVKKKLLEEGFEVVVRSAGSHSMFDLVAFRAPSMQSEGMKPGEIVVVQCKVGQKAEGERRKAREEMLRFEGVYSVAIRVD